jgi:hypothetical protein
MFRWYRKSKICFAHLEDISKEPKRKVIEVESDSESVTPPPPPRPARAFLPKSRWFKRGWTLQELIAPKTLYFYDSTWNEIGEKGELEEEISEITGIDSDVLHNYRLLCTKSIARRMSWASKRETTRTEDIAYCLMGIFNVSMPLLYGEGEKAFTRLQEEIMRSNYDHSLFAWNHHFPNTFFGTSYSLEKAPLLGVGALAPHPVAFSRSANIIPHTMKTEPYAMTIEDCRFTCAFSSIIYLNFLTHTLQYSNAATGTALTPPLRYPSLKCLRRKCLNRETSFAVLPVKISLKLNTRKPHLWEVRMSTSLEQGLSCGLRYHTPFIAVGCVNTARS